MKDKAHIVGNSGRVELKINGMYWAVCMTGSFQAKLIKQS
jgi:hypothetical protein